MPSLIITSSPTGQQGRHFLLANRTLAAGRDPAREIQIVDPKVSRRHFLIKYENSRHVLIETRTTNGLYVNGVAIKEHRLDDGDEIRVGETLLVYHDEDHPSRTDAVNVPRNGHRQHRENKTEIE